MIPLLFLAEHLQKIPYLLSLFLPVAIFFTFGLWLARRKYQSDHKRLNRAVEENDHLAADITRALAPEKDVSKSLFGRLEMQRDHWAAEIKRAQDDLFTERCRTRDLRNQLDQQQGTSLPVPDPDKDRQIQALVDSNNSLEQEIKGLTSSREEILNQLETLRLAADRSTQQYQEHLSGLEAELETLRKENSSPVQTSLPLSDTPPSLQDTFSPSPPLRLTTSSSSKGSVKSSKPNSTTSESTGSSKSPSGTKLNKPPLPKSYPSPIASKKTAGPSKQPLFTKNITASPDLPFLKIKKAAPRTTGRLSLWGSVANRMLKSVGPVTQKLLSKFRSSEAKNTISHNE